MNRVTRPAVRLVRAFTNGEMLFERDGVYFKLTHDDIPELARLQELVMRVETEPCAN